jgi:solute carrier family 8 (sodium/calcium exchanger)
MRSSQLFSQALLAGAAAAAVPGWLDDKFGAEIECAARVGASNTKACYTRQNFTYGYIVEELPAGVPFCDSFILFPGEKLWERRTLQVAYLLGLLFCFLGVAIVADIFMAAIEVITSKERSASRMDAVTRQEQTVTVRVWNPTVANLSLMALGSSAPEILLAVIGTLQTIDSTPDVLGPATIVGSAAFNLLGITAACIYCIPDGEVRRVRQVSVFVLTASTSIFAYLWLYLVLDDEVVRVWEAALTFAFFPLLLLAAWAADNNCFRTNSAGQAGLTESDGGDRTIGIELTTRNADHQVVGRQNANKSTVKDLAREVKAQMGGRHADMAAVQQLLVAKVREAEPPASRMQYRMNAVRMLSGAKRVVGQRGAKANPEAADPVAAQAAGVAAGAAAGAAGTRFEAGAAAAMPAPSSPVDPLASALTFRSPSYAVAEGAGFVELVVLRQGPANFECRVGYATKDGTANADEDYVPVRDGLLTFASGERQKTLKITIVDDNQWEPDETFTVHLSAPWAPSGQRAILGAATTSEVTILNDDNPGHFSFALPEYMVRESEPCAELSVRRRNGCDGVVTVAYKTVDDTATHDIDYIHTEGKLTFQHGEASKTLTVPILDNDHDEETFNAFRVLLTDPEGGALLSANKLASVVICHDDQFTGMISSVAALMQLKKSRFKLSTSSWAEQFANAISMHGDVDEDGSPLSPSGFDYFMHFATIGWKVFFAFIPPTEYYGGWVTFTVAIMFIGLLTAVIGELAGLFGCVAGLETSITAITFVALGTSLPDTFASMTAAKQDRHADAAIGNVTGSNSVNVFLGMGLPWVIAVVMKGGDYPVPKGDLVFSIMLFTACAVTLFAVLALRRWTCGGELGGPRCAKIVSAVFCFGLWIVYVLGSVANTKGWV